MGLRRLTQINDADFGPAFDAGLAQARANIAAIAGNPAAPTFDNTIAALERAETLLGRVGGVFWNLSGADSNPAREALEVELAPKLSAYSSELTSNKALFARVQALWDRRGELGLTAEQGRVLDLYRRMFVRAGAELSGADSDRMAAVMARLASLGTQFSQNVLAEERGWHMALSEEDLEGLPDFVVTTARAAGAERG